LKKKDGAVHRQKILAEKLEKTTVTNDEDGVPVASHKLPVAGHHGWIT
jgi:hypothetical protein